MNSFIILVALIPIASALTVNTPTNAVVCQPLQFTWAADDSQAPFYLSLIPAGQPGEKAMKQFPAQQGTSYTWPKVDLPVGTSFTVSLKDGNGKQAYSAPTTVQSGTDSSCVSDEVMEGKEANQSSSSATPTNSPGAASGTSSSPMAAAVHTPSPSPSSSAPAKQEAAKSSGGGGASPSQSPPSVKANSVARDISSGAIVGMMLAVGLTTILVSLVV